MFVGGLGMARRQGSGDDARADAVAPDVVLTNFECHGLGQMDDRRLGDAVKMWRVTSLQASHRGGVDDRAAACGPDRRNGVFDA